MGTLKKAAPAAIALFYLAIALEVIIMVSPFAAYFYSLYAPVLGFMDALPYTRWLTGFFLPHIALTNDPFLTAMNFLGPLLLVLGIAIFFVCAIQVYGKKILGKGVAVGGFYCFVRHPQYLGLAIASLGLLLFWPRFIILILYVTMLYLYYLLARNEEQRMERKFGAAYSEYALQVPMFLPGNPGGRLFQAATGRSKASAAGAAGGYLVGLLLSTLLGFGLRAYTKSQMTTIENDGFVAVALTPIPEERLKSIVEIAVDDSDVRSVLASTMEEPAPTLLAYVLPTGYMMQGLLFDSEEHRRHHGEGAQFNIGQALRHLGEMLMLHPFRQLQMGSQEAQVRVVFMAASADGGRPIPPGGVFGMNVKRTPLMFADVDTRSGRVYMVMKTEQRHRWGNVPVPVF